MRVLIVGCGYLGFPLGAALVAQGHEVFGLRRNPAAEQELKAAGIHPIFADISQAADLIGVPASFDWVVHCAAAGGGTAEDYQRVYYLGTKNLIEWLGADPPQKFVYTGSTGVYAQNDGCWVDETSAAEPVAETARVLADTEALLLEAARLRNFPAVILRLAGIYGPGRGYWMKEYRENRRLSEAGAERFLNMIHRDDAVGCVIAALQKGRPGQIYNAVDDEPVSQSVFLQWLSLPPSPSAPDSSSRSKRGSTNKRVRNTKLKTELAYQFRYPTFRQGYSHLAQSFHRSD